MKVGYLSALVVSALFVTGAVAAEPERSLHVGENRAVTQSQDITADERIYYQFTGLGGQAIGVLEIEHLETGVTKTIPLVSVEDGYSVAGGGASLHYIGTNADWSSYSVQQNGSAIGFLHVNNFTGQTHFVEIQ